jgi:hypothetical protein
VRRDKVVDGGHIGGIVGGANSRGGGDEVADGYGNKFQSQGCYTETLFSEDGLVSSGEGDDQEIAEAVGGATDRGQWARKQTFRRAGTIMS